MSQAKRSRKRAAGLDSWTADAFSQLGETVFRKLAEVWNACLTAGKVSTARRKIKIVLVAKPEGCWRPIALTAVAYRLGLAAVLRACKAWFASSIAAELYGGGPGPGSLYL